MTDTNAPHYAGHRARLRERLTRDSVSLADYELLELVLASVLPRRDTKPLAKELVQRFGSLGGALRADPNKLADVNGVGPGVQAHWRLLQEVFARLAEEPALTRDVLCDPDLVAEAAKARIGSKGIEEFWAAFLDNKNRVIAWERMNRGTVGETPVYPREIMARALRLEAAGVILAHNHPGGDPHPSAEDIELTRRIVRAGQELGVRVLDHLVVTDCEHYSFHDHGRL
ncbi:RadC family protein [Pseudodesulfovibrio tunisiensis]|uniref:RadC family protein n=1 Tax=Pseudodesulfovibrio tunisiensis TaxID=463192 RepID=UPI001FB23481|nr:DNA repair protein RadC [Pseudodesulfovibrio tunisiensis]